MAQASLFRLAVLALLLALVWLSASAIDTGLKDGACPTTNVKNPHLPYSPPPFLDDGIVTGDIRNTDTDISCINALLQRLDLQADEGGFQDVHSLLVFKDGQLLLESYFAGNDDYIDFKNGIQRVSRPDVQWGPDKQHYIASVNKSLTSILTGIALNQMQTTVDQPLAPFLPDYQSYFEEPNKAALGWRDLLTMQAGFVWDEWESDDLKQLWQSDDFTGFLLGKASNGPQSEWRYNSAVPNVVLHALDNLLDEPVRSWADKAFYQKLGISDYRWESQPGGLPEGSARMFMRPRDMLKIGISIADNGVWQGHQVVPAAWVDAISTTQVHGPAGDYSYFFWVRELDGVRYISADGDGGQYINIFPEHNLVIVMTAGNYLQWPLYKEQADDIMANYLFPAFEIKGNITDVSSGKGAN